MTAFLLPRPEELPWPPMRLVMHWTAGGATASQNDRKHYHILVQQDQQIVPGFPKLAANCANITGPPWSHDTPDGYAAHTRGFNSWTLGASMCGMLNAVEGGDPGPFPLQPLQVETFIGLMAGICERYGLWPTRHRVMTHEEVQRLHGIAQPGKWDIRYLPTTDSGLVTGAACGEYLRKRIMDAIRG